MPTNWQGRCPYLARAESAPNSARTAIAECRDEEVLSFWRTTLMAADWLLLFPPRIVARSTPQKQYSSSSTPNVRFRNNVSCN
jgi:hypothetical protein